MEVGGNALHEGGLASPRHPDRDDDMWFCFRARARLSVQRRAHGGKREVFPGQTKSN